VRACSKRVAHVRGGLTACRRPPMSRGARGSASEHMIADTHPRANACAQTNRPTRTNIAAKHPDTRTQTHTHARARTQTHSHTHAHTRTHTHKQTNSTTKPLTRSRAQLYAATHTRTHSRTLAGNRNAAVARGRSGCAAPRNMIILILSPIYSGLFIASRDIARLLVFEPDL
jgi:hypothetical protein